MNLLKETHLKTVTGNPNTDAQIVTVCMMATIANAADIIFITQECNKINIRWKQN